MTDSEAQLIAAIYRSAKAETPIHRAQFGRVRPAAAARKQGRPSLAEAIRAAALDE